MNARKQYVVMLVLALLGGTALVAVTSAAPPSTPLAQGGAPAVISYQGEVWVGGSPYTGDGYFKFAVVDAGGSTSYWSNDGTTGGAEPTAAVQLTANEGLFSVLLGDTALGGMTQALTASVFSQPDRYLRVWFSTSAGGPFVQLAPDTRIAAAPYALQAQEAADADTVDGYEGAALEESSEIDADIAAHAAIAAAHHVRYADAEAWAAVLANDGSGSGLDADTVDGLHASAIAVDGHDHWGEIWTGTGTGLGVSGGSIGFSGNGTTTGVLGSASSTTGRGVQGYVDASSGDTYGVYGRSASTTGRGVYGYANATSGVNFGVYGESDSSIGRGVAGYGLFGVYGESDSDLGSGVFGYATDTSGTTHGVQGVSDSTSGRGVYGYATAASGTTYGVYGKTDSTSGLGVYGDATAASGTAYGVYGESDSTSGRGVYGNATAASGTTYGVYGRSGSSGGRGVYGYGGTYGVYGEASATSGTRYGVYGESHSPDGYGVRGYNDASSGYPIGVYGSAPVSSNGRGVYGISAYGVYGETWNPDGYALYGEAMASSGTSYGVYGESNSSNGYGGYFVNSGTDGTALYATGDGSGRGDATLRVDNTETTDGVAAYVTNDSNYATAHFYNASNGEVLYLQNGGIDPVGNGGGDFIKAVNEPEGDVQFRVSSGGFVYADGGYRCGNSLNNTVIPTIPPGFVVNGLTESSIEPCLQDDTPADFAEMLPAVGSLEPGDVLAIGPDGNLIQSTQPSQTTVVGVYSFRPSFLGNSQFADKDGYVPLALIGIVPVKASAENGAIQPGDLLVSSSTPGHAMKAGANPPQGAVIGKALGPLTENTGFVQMLVTLQ
jgi:hypothetical protein